MHTIKLCVAFCESGIRITRRPSRRYFTRINTFTAVLRADVSLSSDFFLLFSFRFENQMFSFHPQYKRVHL